MRYAVVGGVVLLAQAAIAADRPAMADVDRVRIAEAFRLADAVGNKIWPDWDKAPFAVLLITPDHEFLVRHPRPSKDFLGGEEEPVLKQKVWHRKRTFSPELMATFPAVGGVPTIVIGRAEGTAAKTSTRWVVTLLHEHFHQLQNSQPRYYADVDSLGLARGDTTGRWMLNYPFPYDQPKVKERFAAQAKALAEALNARAGPDLPKKLAAYVEARKALRDILEPDDYKYLAFQAWQEGIARYTEYHVALAAADYEPTRAFRDLKDYTSFKDDAAATLARIEKELTTVQLDRMKRTAFYALGAGEGLLLDAARPDWRKRYFTDRFTLDPHFKPAK
jgi:hypothetical protein